ncbi:hypothetical protein Tco_1533100 [Tanacetum coccineum]
MTRLSTKPKIVVEGCVPRLRGDLGFKYHDSIFGGKILVEMENEVFDNLTSTLSFPVERPPRMVFGEDSQIGFEGDHSEPKGKEMSFRNFIYNKDDEDLTFLPKDSSLGFNTGSPYVSISIEPPRTDEEPAIEPTTEPVNERMDTTVDLRGSPKGDTFCRFTAVSDAPACRERSSKQGRFIEALIKRKLAFWQAVWIMPVNRRSRELLKDIEKMRG